jgi:hypothetical protein
MKLQIPALSVAQWIAAAILILILVVGEASFLWSFDPFHRRAHAEEKAVTATVQAETNQAAATIAGSAAVETRIIHETTERVVHDVQQAPSASAPLPDDLRTALCAGLSELRHGGEACTDSGSSEPR